MLLVGLTGGLASGKSTVARMLAERGAVVVDADELSRWAVAPGTAGLARVVERFGDGVLTSAGELDRAALGRIVFADPEERRALEAIVHPEVFRLLGEEVAAHRDTDDIVIFDAPLIVETGFDRTCDVVVVVTAEADQQVARAAARGMAPDDARARLEAQTPASEREARADLVVRNVGSLEDLEREVDRIWDDLRWRAA